MEEKNKKEYLKNVESPEFNNAIETGETLKQIFTLFDKLDTEYKHIVITELKTRIRQERKQPEENKTETGLRGLIGANERVGSTFKSLGNLLGKNKK